MNPLDKLPKLICIDFFSKLKKLSLNLLSNNCSPKIEINAGTININVYKLKPKEFPVLQEVVKTSLEEGKLLIVDKAKETLEDFKKVDSQDQNRKLLEYFKGKIPTKDIEILRASLYLKNVFERGENVSNLKDDIVTRYGDRGRNICNLCSAGYFTSQIKPLYEEMYSQPDFSLNKFLAIYEIIVTESPYAFFINSWMSDKQAMDEVLKRMEVSRRYGIKYLNIHGIGRENTEKIATLLKELAPQLTQTPEITRGERFIAVKIWF